MNSKVDNDYSTNEPFVNIYENGDIVKITALASGAEIDDIKLELNNNKLNITIDKEKDNSSQKHIREERIFGEFSKTVRLPYRVDENKIDASLEDGILTVTLEKSEDAKPKKIEIH
jgi:HSP20 family protein